MCVSPELVVPVTAISNVCGPGASPETLKTGSDLRPKLPGAAGPAVSTWVGPPPSIDTFAIPHILHLSPIQLTPVPVKANVAVPALRSYLGGAYAEVSSGIAVDPAGGTYVAGITKSPDFPTANAFQPVHAGGSPVWPVGVVTDAFVAKIVNEP
jgi:hypothetical protein